ncbi:MAG TPA: iron ABC transporter permease [Myxococcales bacterium]|nr:iron ABC transporter permease [Myxococcales bacterium]
MTLRSPAARFRIDASAGVLALFAVALCILVVLPIGWLVAFGFSDRAGRFTLANFRLLVTDAAFIQPLLTTLVLSVSASLICCVVAAPMGWLVSRTDMPLRRAIRFLVMASFVTPPFLGAIAWELLAAPNSGLLNQLGRASMGGGGRALFDVYTLPGLIFVVSCYTFPYVFVLVTNALDRIPCDLEDASAMLGASTWRTARRVTIPLALPAVAAGALIAFLQAMTLFGAPGILALPAGFHTMTTKIWSLFQYPPKPELAAAASLPLLVVTVVLLRAQSAVLGRRGYAVVGGRGGEPRAVRLGALRWPALASCLAVLSLPVFLPYAALVNAAFSRIPSQPLTAGRFTLDHVRFVFGELSATSLALRNTLVLGLLAASLGTLLALVISYLTSRAAVRGHRVLAFLATAPIAIPAIALGVGLFLAYTRGPVVLYGTLWILLVAYVTIELPAAYQQLHASFRALSPEMEEASRVLGASRLRTLRDVTAPLLGPSLIATWCFVFVAVVRELSAAAILFTSETKVLSVLIFDLNESGDLAAIAVLGLTMLILSAVVIAVANLVPRVTKRARTERPILAWGAATTERLRR